MADYKKKKVVKKVPVQKAQKENRTENISMRSFKRQVNTVNSAQSAKPELRLIRGKKSDIRLSFVVSLAVIIVLVCVYLIILLFHPIGVTEYFSSLYKTIGTGDVYSADQNHGDIIQCIRGNDYYYLLSDTKVECINNNGKFISSIDHGLAKPVIEISETRYLVYGQGERSVKIYNFDNEVSNLYYDEQILCADIADNGNFAVATYTDGYDSVVRVYNKNEKVIYEWYSSAGTVSSVSLTSNGKRLLVSTFNAADGVFKTKLSLLSFDSADPEMSFTFEDDLIYGIYHLSNNTVCAVSENNVRFVDLKEGTLKTEETEYTYKMADYSENNLTVLSNLSANTDKNRFAVYTGKAEKSSSFSVDFPVSNIAYKADRMYVLSNSQVYQLDSNGSIIQSASVPFDTKVIVPVSEKYIVAVSDTSISKVLFE